MSGTTNCVFRSYQYYISKRARVELIFNSDKTILGTERFVVAARYEANMIHAASAR